MDTPAKDIHAKSFQKALHASDLSGNRSFYDIRAWGGEVAMMFSAIVSPILLLHALAGALLALISVLFLNHAGHLSAVFWRLILSVSILMIAFPLIIFPDDFFSFSILLFLIFLAIGLCFLCAAIYLLSQSLRELSSYLQTRHRKT